MKIAAGVVLWLALSPLFAWMAGRFIRVGMTELQPGQNKLAEQE